MNSFNPMGKKDQEHLRTMHHANSNGIYREPEFYSARGLGAPHRPIDESEREKSKLLGETEL